MTDIFSYPLNKLDGWNWKITICSGPIIISSQKTILVHISSSTDKYQFIWGRLDDTTSLRENAINRWEEVLWHKNITLSSDDPLCIAWEIERDWESEEVVLFHYEAILKDENEIWEGEWKTLDELEELSKKEMLSSENVLIASRYFLGK